MVTVEQNSIPLERFITQKLSKICYTLGFFIALSDAATGYFQFRSMDYALFGASFSVLYLCGLVSINYVPLSVSRTMFVVLICLDFAITLWFVGRFIGVEMYIVCIVIVPLLIFAKSEHFLLGANYFIIIILVTCAEIWASITEPRLLLEADDKHAVYNLTLFLVCATVPLIIFLFSRSSVKNFLNLQRERNRSEQMLRDLLPQIVADKVIRGENFDAQSNGECTVLFADLVGFTRLSEKLSPIHLVELLNDIFTEIDALCEKLGVEKIKTIGDCYMAATGALDNRGYPAAMVHLGFGIVEIVRHYADVTGYPLAVRVGINTGQAISGLIGTKRRLFDIWGQTVNVAQLLESKCLTNQVLISESMRWRLRDNFAYSDAVEISSKSGINMSGYYVVAASP